MKLFVLAFLVCIASVNVQAKPNEMRLGVLLPLSGQKAQMGLALRDGIENAKKEFPEEFSRIKLFYEDSRGDPRAAISGLRRLLDLRRVEVIIGFSSDMPASLQKYVGARGASALLIQQLFEYSIPGELVFNIGVSTKSLEKMIQSWLRTRRCRRARALMVDHPGVQELTQELLSKNKSLKLTTKYRISEFDFRNGLIKANHKKVDCVLAAVPSTQVGRFLAQVRSQLVGKKIALLQVGGDRLAKSKMPEIEKNSLVTITQGVDSESEMAKSGVSFTRILAYEQGYTAAVLLSSLEAYTTTEINSALKLVENHKSTLGNLSFIETDSKQFFEIKPKFRIIWNRRKRRKRR